MNEDPNLIKSLASKCLLALAVPFGLVASLAGGCAINEIDTGAREAFVFWGALRLLALSGAAAAICFFAALWLQYCDSK
jgi:hypothetical protein